MNRRGFLRALGVGAATCAAGLLSPVRAIAGESAALRQVETRLRNMMIDNAELASQQRVVACRSVEEVIFNISPVHTPFDRETQFAKSKALRDHVDSLHEWTTDELS